MNQKPSTFFGLVAHHHNSNLRTRRGCFFGQAKGLFVWHRKAKSCTQQQHNSNSSNIAAHEFACAAYFASLTPGGPRGRVAPPLVPPLSMAEHDAHHGPRCIARGLCTLTGALGMAVTQPLAGMWSHPRRASGAPPRTRATAMPMAAGFLSHFHCPLFKYKSHLRYNMLSSLPAGVTRPSLVVLWGCSHPPLTVFFFVVTVPHTGSCTSGWHAPDGLCPPPAVRVCSVRQLGYAYPDRRLACAFRLWPSTATS